MLIVCKNSHMVDCGQGAITPNSPTIVQGYQHSSNSLFQIADYAKLAKKVIKLINATLYSLRTQKMVSTDDHHLYCHF